jgi:hypothetical protein
MYPSLKSSFEKWLFKRYEKIHNIDKGNVPWKVWYKAIIYRRYGKEKD